RLQRKCACGGSEGLAAGCESCRTQKLLGLQAQLAVGRAGDRFEAEADQVADRVLAGHRAAPDAAAPVRVQRVDTGGGGLGEAPAEVQQVLAAPARRLDDATRGFFETRFGHDFSHVRVHDDAEADRSARAVGAHAYTVGQDLVFAQGQYRPHTDTGRRLLAHELTHTLQQSGGSRAVQRSPCGHDGQPTNCRAELGVLKLRDAGGKVGQMISIDRWIADEGLPKAFPGQWAAQVQSPPNPLKQGEDRGFIDAVRVNDAGALGLEVVEIKARSVEGGGCALATAEARAYANVLTLIKPQVLALSAGLARQGGVRVSGGCRSAKADERRKLQAAGLDFNDGNAMLAWCLINSLQERLNKTYTQAFSDMTAGPFGGGDGKKTYDMWPPMRIDCPKKKGKKRTGWTFLGYQVNDKGGASYGCRDECFEDDEEEKRRTQELVKEDEVRKGKQTAPRQSVPSEMYIDPPARGGDVDEDKPPVELPSGGVSVTDAIAAGGAAVVTLATLHQAAKALRGRELEAARETAARVLAEARAKGAFDVARKLNSARLAKDFGTKAYDKTVTTVAEGVEKTALKDAGFLAKYGAKSARFLGRAAAVLGVLMLAKDAAAAVSHISKGGTIELGLRGMDASLEGDTNLKTQGLPGQQDVRGDVKLKDTQIDIETKGFPSVKGNVNLEADKLTVRGRAGDGSAKINFTAKYKNTTITITRDGHVQGGKLTMEGGSEISDADIEIDLPPGVNLTKPRDPNTSVVIQGGKIKITEVGGGGGGAGQGGTPSTPATTPTTPPPTDSGGGSGSGSTQTPSQAPGGQGSGTAQPGAAGKTGAQQPDINDLVRQVQQSNGLRTLYAGLLGKDDGVPVTAEMLGRLVDLKASFDRHPAIVQEILAGLKPAQITDPIKQIIEPIEQRMRQADQKLAKARDQAIADAKAKPPGEGRLGSTPEPGKGDKGDKGEKADKADKADKAGKAAAGEPDIDLSSVREVRMNDLLPQLERPLQVDPG
ncbi:MAG: hypothetical protein JWQ03_2182, partial [Variovorax sp.]|nr:hypothetical protein [Variovorax sp.]